MRFRNLNSWNVLFLGPDYGGGRDDHLAVSLDFPLSACIPVCLSPKPTATTSGAKTLGLLTQIHFGDRILFH